MEQTRQPNPTIAPDELGSDGAQRSDIDVRTDKVDRAADVKFPDSRDLFQEGVIGLTQN